MVANFILLAIGPGDPVFPILGGGLPAGCVLPYTSGSVQNIWEGLS